MFDKGFFGGLFDFNGDGKLDSFEKAADFATFVNLISDDKEETEAEDGSVKKFISDPIEEDEGDLSYFDLDYEELAYMDEDERSEALEDAGLDPDDFDF